MALAALIAYGRYRDAFHPAVFTAPLMIAGYCFWPMLLDRNNELTMLLGNEALVRVQAYYFVGLLCLTSGMLWTRGRRLSSPRELSPWRSLTSTVSGDRTRRKLLRLAFILGGIAIFSYVNSIANVGGFEAAYSIYKGGGRASSGYLGEAYLLAYPAALIYALARQGRGLRPVDWIIISIMLSPNFLQGTLGVRRGPLFISLATLFVSWVVSRGRAPGIFRTSIAISLILCSVIFLWTQRQSWFAEEIPTSRVGLAATLLPDESSLSQNDYVSGVGSALITEYYDAFFWGKRWWVDLLVRPIPRQIWPTKYQDVGAYWKTGGNPTGFEEHEQMAALGFALPAGHSIGVLSDLYSEWWWFAIAVLFGLGRFLRWLWFKHRMIGQVWTVIFLGAIGLCVYLPTQSFSAWYQRFLVMSIGTFLAWRWFVGRDVRKTRTEPAAQVAIPVDGNPRG